MNTNTNPSKRRKLFEPTNITYDFEKEQKLQNNQQQEIIRYQQEILKSQIKDYMNYLQILYNLLTFINNPNNTERIIKIEKLINDLKILSRNVNKNNDIKPKINNYKLIKNNPINNIIKKDNIRKIIAKFKENKVSPEFISKLENNINKENFDWKKYKNNFKSHLLNYSQRNRNPISPLVFPLQNQNHNVASIPLQNQNHNVASIPLQNQNYNAASIPLQNQNHNAASILFELIKGQDLTSTDPGPSSATIDNNIPRTARSINARAARSNNSRAAGLLMQLAHTQKIIEYSKLFNMNQNQNVKNLINTNLLKNQRNIEKIINRIYDKIYKKIIDKYFKVYQIYFFAQPIKSRLEFKKNKIMEAKSKDKIVIFLKKENKLDYIRQLIEIKKTINRSFEEKNYDEMIECYNKLLDLEKTAKSNAEMHARYINKI